MNVRSNVGFVLGAVTLGLACTGHAEDAKPREPNVVAVEGASASPTASSERTAIRERKVKRAIEAYLRAEAKGDYVAMIPLFTPDARLKYTYDWGIGHEDAVYELDLSKPMDPDTTYVDHAEGYETVTRKSRIESLSLESTGASEASVIVTERYRYQGHEGTATTKLRFTLKEVDGAARIALLTSVTKYR